MNEEIVRMRRKWMHRYGISADEIEEFCNLDDYPGTLEGEKEELEAVKQIEEMNRKRKQG